MNEQEDDLKENNAMIPNYIMDNLTTTGSDGIIAMVFVDNSIRIKAKSKPGTVQFSTFDFN